MDTQNPNRTDENQEQTPTQMPPDLSRGSQPPVGAPPEGDQGAESDERHGGTDTDQPAQPIPDSTGK